MRMRTISAAVIGIGGVLALTACSGHSGLQALEEQFASEDALPAAIDLGDTIDRESSRLLTTHEQVRYFAARSADSSIGCIIVVPPDADPHWFSGCGSLGATDVIVTASAPPSNRAASLVRDDSDTRALESEGWIRIDDNVLIPSP
ncbi:hypothetical protein CQ017_00305 [Arthrobacter sp. MYb224]|nr:hypothetical protein CQ017_00305 [Arthrobacter sp. MYb224]